jgi:hypothetical protein
MRFLSRDDDPGRPGSGLLERPGFQKLVAFVCSGSAGAVFCLPLPLPRDDSHVGGWPQHRRGADRSRRRRVDR